MPNPLTNKQRIEAIKNSDRKNSYIDSFSNYSKELSKAEKEYKLKEINKFYDSKAVDSGDLLERDFQNKWGGQSSHAYKMEKDPLYRKEVLEQLKKPSNQGEINYPRNDLRRDDVIAPNARWQYSHLNDEQSKEMSDFSNEVIASALPIPVLEKMGKIPSIFKAGKKYINTATKINKQSPIYRGVYLNDEIRNLSKFKGKSDDEILDIMGTTIPGNTGTRRKRQLNQTLNFEKDYDSALGHIGKFTDERAISTLGNTKDLTSGEMYILKVQPDDLPFITADQQNILYKQHIDNWKLKNNNSPILGDDAKNIDMEILKKYGDAPAFKSEGVNVIKGNFPQYIGEENVKIGNLIEAKKVTRQDYKNYLDKLRNQ